MKRICIVVPIYNAAELLLRTLDRIPPQVWDDVEEVVVCDDCSPDHTYTAALSYKTERGREKLRVLRNRRNRGYGGIQKRAYLYALHRGFDVVVLLHGDGQYAPELLPQLLAPILSGEADAVLGSRMMSECDPRRGGMPLYKFYGNRILTWMQRHMTGLHLAEFHTGYRIYSCAALRQLPIVRNSETWHFDTQILLQLFARGLRIKEIPIPTFYGDEVSHLNGIPYAVHCLWEAFKFRLTRSGVWHSRLYDLGKAEYEFKPHRGSSHTQMLELLAKAPAGSRILDVGAAAGYLDRELQARGHRVTAIEQDPVRAEQARPYCEELIIGDVEALDVRGHAAQFDYLVLGDVLEHLKDPPATLGRLLETLKPGGRIIACVPRAGAGRWAGGDDGAGDARPAADDVSESRAPRLAPGLARHAVRRNTLPAAAADAGIPVHHRGGKGGVAGERARRGAGAGRGGAGRGGGAGLNSLFRRGFTRSNADKSLGVFRSAFIRVNPRRELIFGEPPSPTSGNAFPVKNRSSNSSFSRAAAS